MFAAGFFAFGLEAEMGDFGVEVDFGVAEEAGFVTAETGQK